MSLLPEDISWGDWDWIRTGELPDGINREEMADATVWERNRRRRRGVNSNAAQLQAGWVAIKNLWP